MVSAFLNTVKIPEFRRRILFTLAVIVVVRLGAAITTPGVNQAVLQEWFRTRFQPDWRWSCRALQFVQRRRARKLRNLFPGHHALHQRIDHDAVADGGDSPAWQVAARRWRAAKDHAVDALCDARACAFFRVICWRCHFSTRNRITRCCRGSPTRSGTSEFR